MARPPNILWIVTTQWRAQAFGYAGDANARTPALDRLAVRSINFAQAVTPHPFGPFARAALLTGIASPENGVSDYFDPLPAATRTIAHDLNERGYATGYFGKWHLARRDPAAPLVGEAHARTIVPPEARGGFGFWEGFESGFLLNDPWLHGSCFPEPRQFPGYQSEVVAGRAFEWLREQTAPWFAVVSIEAPHPPYFAPADGVAARAPDTIVLAPNVPRGGDVESQARRELAGYYAHIEATDRALGKLLSAVDANVAERGRTVVVATSVHGDMHGSHGHFRKGWPFEESIRVPLLVAGTGLPAAASSAAASLLDLRSWTNAWSEGDFAMRTADQAHISMPSVVALPGQCDRVWRGVRSCRRKLVLRADCTPWLFFDLENDPYELNDLSTDSRWQEELQRWRRVVAA